MTVRDLLERQSARVQRFGIADLIASAPVVANGVAEPEMSGEFVNRETLERGIARLRDDSEARKRALSVLEESLAAFPERLRPIELLNNFEALLDIYTGCPLDEWRRKWGSRRSPGETK